MFKNTCRQTCVTTNYTATKHFDFLLPYLSLLELTMEEEVQGEPILGGYNFEFIDELSPGQACSICLLAMRSAVQTVCGHRFCHSCLLESFRWCVICTVYIIQLSSCILYFVYFSAGRYECSERKVERAKCSQLITCSVIFFFILYSFLLSARKCEETDLYN